MTDMPMSGSSNMSLGRGVRTIHMAALAAVCKRILTGQADLQQICMGRFAHDSKQPFVKGDPAVIWFLATALAGSLGWLGA